MVTAAPAYALLIHRLLLLETNENHQMGAWFCSCFLHGRTSQRLDKFPSTEKPDLCDGNCAIWCLSAYCGLSWIPQMLKRGKLRDRFGIQGNACNDCLVSAPPAQSGCMSASIGVLLTF